MKLETSVELLERVRARNGNASWYRLGKIIPASENTVANWRHGRTTIDRKFVTRIAALLDDSPEYVLLCLEAERETSAELRKLWRRIAERVIRLPAPIILLAVLGLSTAPRGAGATELDVGSAGELSNQQLIHYAQLRTRRRRRLLTLLRCLKSRPTAPLFNIWARIRSTALTPRGFPLSPAYT